MRIPRKPPPLEKLLADLAPESGLLAAYLTSVADPGPGDRYLHYDKLRHLDPPESMTHDEWWLALKLARAPLLKNLPFTATDDRPFRYALVDPVLEMIQAVERNASGRIAISEQVTSPRTRERYVVSSLIREAVTSSQLEGAATTMRVAKEMIRQGRPPRDRSEQMILNNYRAMRLVREVQTEAMTPELLLRIHGAITDDTLEVPGASARFRTTEEPVHVVDGTGNVLHDPPPADRLPGRMDALCRFANGEVPSTYIPPVVRAILLHFWLAYDHPFVDGNGRTARNLFYWSMLREGYWLVEYVSISKVVLDAPAQYAQAFLLCETDENDLTYFVLHQLRALLEAIEELHGYLDRKSGELQEVRLLLRQSTAINHRQLALLTYALRHPDAEFTIESHRASHDVVYQTARTDLMELAERGLLVKTKVGRKFVFVPVRDLEKRIRTLEPSA